MSDHKDIKDDLYVEGFDDNGEMNICSVAQSYEEHDHDIWLSKKEAKVLADFIYNKLNQYP